MKVVEKSLAGLNIQLSYSNEKLGRILEKELAHYASFDGSGNLDVHFILNPPKGMTLLSNNPSSFFLFDRGFGTKWGAYTVVWENSKNEVLKVYFFLTSNEKSLLYKLKGLQYSHPYEDIAQIFHEGVLQPTILLFFNDRISLLHGSAVASNDGRSFVFGGTGGVGKTSIELELLLNDQYSFISDDIAFLNAKGEVFTNLNYPKIYGYNLIGYPAVEKQMWTNRRLTDKVWWSVQKRLRKPDRYRRRVDPFLFYNRGITQKSELDHYIILFRNNVSNLKIRPLDAQSAASLSLSVIRTEFARVFDLLQFLEFNSFKELETLNETVVLNNILKIYTEAFSNCHLWLLEVPLNFSARDIKLSIRDVLKQL